MLRIVSPLQQESEGLKYAIYGSNKTIPTSAFDVQKPGDWQPIAFVDTTVLGKGQHSTSIVAKGSSIGSYRYLLIHCPKSDIGNRSIFVGGTRTYPRQPFRAQGVVAWWYCWELPGGPAVGC